PVHFVGSTKRGCCLILTVKFPACPSTRSTSLKVRMSMSLCRPISTRRGAMTPPMAGLRSARYTLMPPLARSRAACMPPIPPPTTMAAPTGGVLESSGRMGNNLRRGRLPRGSLLDRLEIQGQRSIDHVCPVAERHLHQQHRRGDDDVQGIRDKSCVRQA